MEIYMAKDASGRRADYDLVLDVVAPRNRDVRFTPAGIVLRGEKRITEISSISVNGAIAMAGGVIPGQRLMVDLKMRHVKVIDRMTLPESRAIDKVLRDLCKTERYQQWKYGEYLPDSDFGGISEKEWPKWLFCIRRLVDHGRLRVVKGGELLPSLADIAKMGDITFFVGNVRSRNEDKPFNVIGPQNASQFETASA
jgi:hypothetical protein